jgi:DNA-binding transcriptional MerR regulator
LSKKLFYRIGEACKLLDIQPYVLRYWETEFPVLQPRKSKAGQRVYSEEELQLIQRIKQLLYEEGYTIAGAKKKLDAELAGESSAPEPAPVAASLAEAAAAARPPATASRRARTVGSGDGAAVGDHATMATKPPSSLDSAAVEQVERLRSGLQEALAEAREILRLLSA